MMPQFKDGLYAGFSYEQASRKALELTDIAARTGQTVRLSEHLNALVKIMRSQ